MSKLPPPMNLEGMNLEAIHEAIQDCHDWPGMKHPSDHHRLAMHAACEAMRLEGDLEAAQQEIAARDAEIAKMQEQFREFAERSESDAMELRKEIADLKRGGVVVPEIPTWEDGESKLRRGEKLTALEKFVIDHDWSKTDTQFRDGLEAVFDELRTSLRAQPTQEPTP